MHSSPGQAWKGHGARSPRARAAPAGGSPPEAPSLRPRGSSRRRPGVSPAPGVSPLRPAPPGVPSPPPLPPLPAIAPPPPAPVVSFPLLPHPPPPTAAGREAGGGPRGRLAEGHASPSAGDEAAEKRRDPAARPTRWYLLPGPLPEAAPWEPRQHVAPQEREGSGRLWKVLSRHGRPPSTGRASRRRVHKEDSAEPSHRLACRAGRPRRPLRAPRLRARAPCRRPSVLLSLVRARARPPACPPSSCPSTARSRPARRKGRGPGRGRAPHWSAAGVELGGAARPAPPPARGERRRRRRRR